MTTAAAKVGLQGR